MQQPTDHRIGGQIVTERPARGRARPPVTYTRTAGIRWPAEKPSELLQFWRLYRRLELRRSHGRLLIDGTSYWK